MMFWFKKKKIVVDAFTIHRSVHELYSIKPAVYHFPEEVKRLESTYADIEPNTQIEYKAPTVKKCLGLIDLYKQGFIMPMWTDLICQPQKSIENKSAVGMMQNPFMFSMHDNRQFKGMFTEHMPIKLHGVWHFREKTGVKFLWNTPTWNQVEHANHFMMLPAIVSYEHQSQTNVNFFINKKSEDFTLISGTPLIHIVPLTEHKVEFKNHLVDEKEYRKIGIPDDYATLRTDRYKRWIREKSNQESKCPFGFGK